MGVLVLLLQPGTAAAELFCMDGGNPVADLTSLTCGPDPDGGPSQDPADCGPAFATVAEALVAVAASEDDTNTLCLTHEGVHSESFVVDNSAGQYGFFNIHFLTQRPGNPASWCPTDDAGDIGIDILGDVGIEQVVSDDCPGDRKTLIRYTSADSVLVGAVLDATGPGAAPVIELIDTHLTVYSSRISGAGATAVGGGGSVTFAESDLSLLAPPAGQAVVDFAGDVTLRRSGLAGNVTDGAPLVRAAELTLQDSKVVHNRVAHTALLEAAPAAAAAVTLLRSEIAENRLVTDAAGVTPPQDDRSLALGAPDPSCAPGALGSPSYAGASQDFTPPDGPLRSEGWLVDVNGSNDSEVDILRNYLLDNGGAGLVRVTLGTSSTAVNFIHNTVRDDEADPLVVLTTDDDLRRLSSFRNLWHAPIAVDLGGSIEAPERVLDAHRTASPDWEAAFAGSPVNGPILAAYDSDGDFRDVSGIEPAKRAALVCGCLTPADCPTEEFEPICPSEGGAQAVLGTDFAESLSAPWPWDGLGGVFVPGVEDIQENRPGAEGWRCGVVIGPRDDDDPNAWSDAVDCGEDPVPPTELDGYPRTCDDRSEEVACFECPGHGDDDDDSGGDDDDSSYDPDNAINCSAKGCGAPFGGPGLGVTTSLLLLGCGLGLGRRRRP